jgi:DNA polymerase
MESGSPAARREELIELYKQVRTCTACGLHESRTQVVFGNGNADAELMFVGEAPGAEEDRQGLPFVGRAGKLLDELLGEIGLDRQEDVFVANVLKSRPPGNRDPQPEEIAACSPYLIRQIELIRPRVICTLGNFATKLLSGSPQGITKVHGRPLDRDFGGVAVRLYPLFHPAAALRTPSVKELLREDFHRLPELMVASRPEVEPGPADPSPADAPVPAQEQPAPQMDLFS